MAVVLLAWLLRAQWSARTFDWGFAAAALARLRWPWLVFALLPVFGTYYGRVLRWAVFLRPLKPQSSRRNLLGATLIGFTAITLFGRAGDLVRPYLIAVKEKVPFASQLAAWLLERVFDLLMASLLLGFALTRVRALGGHLGPGLGWVLSFGGRIVGGFCLVGLLLLLALRHFAEPVRRGLIAGAGFLPARWFGRIEKTITALVQGVEATRSDGALVLMFAYSLLEWALIAACYWSLAQAFVGVINITLVDILTMMGFVAFGGLIQIPGVGGGTQVVATLVLTEVFGVRLELATSFAILLWIITYVAVVPAGLALALKEGLNWQGLRQISREAVE